MGYVGINEDRIVPVASDLTTDADDLEILRGLANAFRVDKKLADGATFVRGEWAVLNSDDKVERPGVTPVAETYLVFCGSDRFDSMATGAVTMFMNSNLIIRTTKYDTGETYAVGDYLTVKDLGGGEAVVTLQAGDEPKLARVHKVEEGHLTYEVGNF